MQVLNRKLLNKYNNLLRNYYKGKGHIFDLAEIESTLQGGTRQTSKKDDNTYYSLAPSYTYDGGHLNEKGQRVVGEQLLLFLSSLGKI